MPELPEVETVKRGVEPSLINSKIKNVKVFERKLRLQVPEIFEKTLTNSIIVSLERRAKYLIINLSNNNSIIFHLGMSGTLALHPYEYKPSKHEHIVIKYKNLNTGVLGTLIFKDHRKFGFADICPTKDVHNHRFLRDLGAEPLDKHCTGKLLYSSLKNKKLDIKKALMDSKIIVGIGNIYASEILFDSKVNPTLSVKNVGPQLCDKIITSTKKILRLAIDSGGSSIQDHRQADGKLGYFQHNFKVYGREGEKCVCCGDKIIKIKQGGRSTFYCKQCQK